MKRAMVTLLLLAVVCARGTPAATNYVGQPGTPGGHYFTDIQSAVDAASAGDLVLVSNGHTLISGDGCYDQSGGGIWLTNGCAVTNTVISGNAAANNGGGAYCSAGGTLAACTLGGNSAFFGGGAYCNFAGMLSGCVLNSNTAFRSGGVHCYHGGMLTACTISSNSAGEYGGGVSCDYGGTIVDCLIAGMNTANEAAGVFCRGGGEVVNCTISSNMAASCAGGVLTTGGGSIVNSIICLNQAPADANWRNYNSGASYRYCCTTPTNSLPGGEGCIADDPLFAMPGVDYHLQSGSPCINTGTNQPWMTGATDFGGNPRIMPVGGIVDMGCYEFVPEPTLTMLLVGSIGLIRQIGRIRQNL